MRPLISYLAYILTLISFLWTKFSHAQVDEYDFLKLKYDRLSQEQKLDTALIVAKQMNRWTLQNEGDVSLRYAVSYRLIANCYSLDLYPDSSLLFNKKSQSALQNQGRTDHLDYAKCLNNLAIIYNYQGNLISAQRYFFDAKWFKHKLERRAKKNDRANRR